MKLVFVAVASALMAGCAMGEATRWVGSANEIVQVEGIPYQVQYVRDATGFDTRMVRVEPIVIMPDMMVEQPWAELRERLRMGVSPAWE